ncbi:uncharacterized protein LOC134102606 isoform X2 [Sardina pilchardus]|uniref:uncharacterized protein LOC134102606 isoform X2 n=1 Tax=Sardina pilchardus TaxID=27697 RepID=UPI002E0F9601
MRMAESQINIPDGLVTMLEGLARSVLKKRPQDIPLFALYYFGKLKEFREGHPNLHIKKLVKEFHNGAAGTLSVVGLKEELQRMEYLKPMSVKSDHATESVRIPCHVKITIIPDELLSQENVSQDICDRGAFSSAIIQPVYQESLSTAVSCRPTESISETNNLPLLPVSTHTTKLSTCVDNNDVTTCDVPRTETKTRLAQPKATTATGVSVCSARCQTLVSQNNQQATTGIAGSRDTQDSSSYKASQAIHNTLLTARQEDPVVSLLPKTAQTECACNHPAHPQYPCTPWNPSFFDRCVYPLYNQPLYYPYYPHHPAYGQPLYYPLYYPYHHEHACCSCSSYRCNSSAQKPDQRNFYAHRDYPPPMPLYQPCSLPSNHCTCSPHLPGGQMAVPPCLTMKPQQNTQMKSTQAPPGISPRQVQPEIGHPSMHPPHGYLPPFAFMGQHPPAATPHNFQSPAYPAVPLPGEEMDDQNAARQCPYSAQHHRGDSLCHIDSNY